MPRRGPPAPITADRLHQALCTGYFYATDDRGANPWDRLPIYWEEEVSAVKELTRRPKK
jgi:hypothetical protein